jgi:hypothetical protein
MGRHLRRLAPVSGLVFLALLIVSFAISGNTPDTDARGSDVVAYFQAHRNAQLAAAIVLAYAIVFGLIWATTLRGYLRSRGGHDSFIAFGYAGYILFAAGVGALAGLTLALADTPGKLDPSAAQALNVLNNDTFFVFLAGLGAFMMGNGLAVALSGALPRWIGWVGFLIGVLAVTPIGWFAIFGMLWWTLVVSILIWLRDWRGVHDAAAGPAAA